MNAFAEANDISWGDVTKLYNGASSLGKKGTWKMCESGSEWLCPLRKHKPLRRPEVNTAKELLIDPDRSCR
jgi:hypothetical protein